MDDDQAAAAGGVAADLQQVVVQPAALALVMEHAGEHALGVVKVIPVRDPLRRSTLASSRPASSVSGGRFSV
ncbi:MAG: hypothetical protein V5B40_04455 [Candidatus Accumulibacter meliphilus]|uniref:hypothetical protein n=1 Tax=Candidatus Accumulibacter meliphilus TaxID=2211374 RepID=UPI002FC39D19